MLFYIFRLFIDPVLFFIVLYRYCGGPLLHRIARVLISIILASLLGFWIGSLAMAGVLALLFSPEELVANFFFLSQLISILPTIVISQLLGAFAVLAFSDLVPKWKNALQIHDFQSKRPVGIVVLAALYMIFALLNALALPVIALWGSLGGVADISLVASLVAVGFLVFGQIVLSIGLYLGKKWAWVLALISTGSALLIEVTALGVLLVLETQGTVAAPWLLVGLFFGSFISLIIVAYLLTSTVRKFFGLANPISTSSVDRAVSTEVD